MLNERMNDMAYTDNPVADYESWDREQNMRLEQLPVCVDCDHPIQDEYAYYINGEWICADCMENYRREVEVY